jgi:hypothetical protein
MKDESRSAGKILRNLPRNQSRQTMFVLVRAITYAVLFMASCWFICPLGSWRGRALLSPQHPERRMGSKWGSRLNSERLREQGI